MRKTLSDKQDELKDRMSRRGPSKWIPGAKLTESQRQEIVELWTGKTLTQAKIAKAYGVAQSLVHAIVANAGHSRKNVPAEIRACAHCGVEVSITGPRRMARESFCCEDHYFKHLHNPAYQRSVWGTRQAREKVRECFNLSDENVVHHVDSNNNNNEMSNLWVFANNADHTSFHRGGDAKPIWRGDQHVDVEDLHSPTAVVQ